jgi:predicted O-linked N-acetylglucosamine transferase (SPINDLY family)
MPDNRQFMIDRFRKLGVSEDRLKVLGGADQETIIKSYDDVDITLDTWPYCGGNTIAESLHQGVPVVTLLGERFSGRYGASLLAVAGCSELVARTQEEYVKIATELSKSQERLLFYRNNLRQMTIDFGLSDAAAFARKLDAAYLQMMESLLPGRAQMYR